VYLAKPFFRLFKFVSCIQQFRRVSSKTVNLKVRIILKFVMKQFKIQIFLLSTEN